MPRKFAGPEKGERAPSRPSGEGERTSISGAVKFGKMLERMQFKGASAGRLFFFHVNIFFVKHLDETKTVVLDNASPHENESDLDLARSAGAKIIFLPQLRPELNPVEHRWPAMKNYMRKMKPRTEDGLMKPHGMSLKMAESKSVKPFFHHRLV